VDLTDLSDQKINKLSKDLMCETLKTNSFFRQDSFKQCVEILVKDKTQILMFSNFF